MIGPKESALVIQGARVFSSTGRNVEPGYLLVRGGRIAAVGAGKPPPSHTEDARIVDVEGRWVLPGLIDAHCHLCYGHADRRDRADPMVSFVGAANARRKLETGVTTVRDVGGMNRLNLALKRAVDLKLVPGPRIIASGDFISAPRGHCYYWAREARGPEEIAAAVNEQLDAGADLIKLMVSGGVAEATENPEHLELTPEEIAVAVKTAHARQVKVAVHAHPAAAMRLSLEAGADSIEHGTFLEPEVIESMVQRRVALVPTFSVYDRMARDVDRIGPEASGLVKRIWEIKVARIKQAVSAGVRIGVGTDAGSYFPPDDIATELGFFVDVLGFTPERALLAATRDNAELLGVAHETGVLQVGKSADLVTVEGNPLEDIRAVSNVHMVMVRGRLLSRNGGTIFKG